MKPEMKKYLGVFPAFYACYDDDNNVSAERTRRFARYLVSKGVNGLYVGGSSGECIYQEKEERKAILEAVMAEVKGECTIIAHVAANSTRTSQELARHAESLGVDAIAAIPPIYFHLPEASIAKYWNDISAAAPHTDFVIYNIPQLAGVALTPSLYRKMLENPRVIGVKNSSMPTQDIQCWRHMGGEDRVVFNGPDEQFIAGFAIGATGGIGGTYSAMPELFLKMYQMVGEGRFVQAQPIQHTVNDIIAKLCSCKGNMYSVIKNVIKLREGLDLGGVRAPLMDCVPEDAPIVKEAAAMIDAAIKQYC